MLAALCACGASSKEVAMAKTAHYSGDKAQLFAETKAVVASKYDVVKSDETTLEVQTKPRWFTPEGLAANDTGDVSMLQDHSLNIAMVVQLLPEGGGYIVKVTPVIARYNKGIPKPEQVNENDASLPGWVEDRTDTLALDIHKALAKYENAPAAGAAPAMTPAAAPEAPAAPAPAAPAEGSAAAPAAPAP
jgi:hypothetical protein